MKFLSSPTAFTTEFRRLTRHYRHFDWAVAWAGGGHDAFKALQKHPEKINRVIVGTHFHQTSPAFIDAFAGNQSVRFRLDQDGLNGVFHPKLYVFSNEETDWEAIIGSANFTAGAFTRNVEHAILLGSSDKAVGIGYADLVNEVATLWHQGRQFSDDELVAYKLRWEKNQRFLDRIAGHATNQNRADSIYNRDLLSFSWDGYVQSLRARKEKWFADRLVILREARNIWDAQPSFAKLSLDERKKICGTASEQILPWRLFGSMRGALNFKAALRDGNPHLLAAPDMIPLTGDVHVEHFEAFIDELRRAFGQTAEEFGKLAVATRILCLRRPDYFVCVDKKNRDGLFKMLGVSPRDVTIQTYWETVIAPLIDTPWWQSTRPATNPDDQTIWDGRVAMVDALFYEGHD